jgi:hypothetical protein
MQNCLSIVICNAIVGWLLLTSIVYAEVEFELSSGKSKEEVLTLDCVNEGEYRLGAYERIFLIEDQWEFDRYKLLIPKLPIVNFATDSLLVVAGWDSRLRSIHTVRSDDDTLVISIKQNPPSRNETGMSRAKFQIVRLPAWDGPVRFEINNKEAFTVLRGDNLKTRVDELWNEILRIRSGGRPTLDQLLGYYRKQWAESIDESELRKTVIGLQKKRPSIDPQPLYYELFSKLIDLRAINAVPRIFSLIDTMDTMGMNDEAFDPAWKTLVAIGGPDVVTGCRQALLSRNPQSRGAAILVLRDLGLPETRDVAYAHLAGPDIQVARCSLDLLKNIGLTKQDVPILVQAIQDLESRMFDPSRGEKSKIVGTASSEDIGSLIYTIGTLGPEASDAIPVLEQLASHPRFPLSKTLQKYAQDALTKIQTP